ncbi:MAG: site-2 protease family protein [Phycisphaerae bacterium]|nr:site-2 protease family protein [Phycisphaerae bacterium]
MDYLAMSVPLLWSQWLWPILLFVFGLGLVVFVHELGHFLVAKAAGITVERLAVGFGPRLFGVVRRGTDYCVNLLPLGGYVKMLGQEDVKEAAETTDPRAFGNKPVGVRLGVVSAGVVMNVLLAGALFVLVAMVGKKYPAPVVGFVRPGFPASQVEIQWLEDSGAPTRAPASAPGQVQAGASDQTRGLRPGDRIVKITDGHSLLCLLSQPVTRFTDIQLVALLAKGDSTYQFTIERREGARRRLGQARMGLKRLPDDSQYVFGIGAAGDTTFGEYEDLITDHPFRDGDSLLAINGQGITHSWDIKPLEKKLTGEPVRITVLRGRRLLDIEVRPQWRLRDDVLWLKNGSRLRALPVSKTKGLIDCLTADGGTVAVSEQELAGGGTREPLDLLGMIPRVRVTGVVKRSAEDQAGVQVGDIIVGYGDRSAPTYHELLEINREYADRGTHMLVSRGGETHKLWIVPEPRSEALGDFTKAADLEHPVVAGIREGSPAAQAGIEPEAVIQTINDQPVENWIDMYRTLAGLAGQEVRVTYQIGARRKTVALGRLDQSVFDPADYTLSIFGAEVAFRPLLVTILERNPLKALGWGAKETCKLVVSTYVTLGRLSQGAVSAKSLTGPLGIGEIAVQAGRRSLIDFVYFLAFISASLAVFNFLPVPVTDGGHAVFLAIEKVRGRPLPPRVIYVAQLMGLALIVAVFLALTWQDALRLWRNSW